MRFQIVADTGATATCPSRTWGQRAVGDGSVAHRRSLELLTQILKRQPILKYKFKYKYMYKYKYMRDQFFIQVRQRIHK